MGITEDLKKKNLNVRHKLILVRGNQDFATLYNDSTGVIEAEVVINLTNVAWYVPLVRGVNDTARISLLNYNTKNSKALPINFRSWELHKNPDLSSSRHHVQLLKTTSNVQHPCFVVIVFQTNRKKPTKERY